MKLNEAAIVTVIINGSGFRPNCSAMVSAMGTIRTAEALLLRASVSRVVAINNPAKTPDNVPSKKYKKISKAIFYH